MSDYTEAQMRDFVKEKKTLHILTPAESKQCLSMLSQVLEERGEGKTSVPISEAIKYRKLLMRREKELLKAQSALLDETGEWELCTDDCPFKTYRHE